MSRPRGTDTVGPFLSTSQWEEERRRTRKNWKNWKRKDDTQLEAVEDLRRRRRGILVNFILPPPSNVYIHTVVNSCKVDANSLVVEHYRSRSVYRLDAWSVWHAARKGPLLCFILPWCSNMGSFDDCCREWRENRKGTTRITSYSSCTALSMSCRCP